MLTVSDGYWGFVHQKRFYRWAYASLTFFAIFAVVVAFFDITEATAYSSYFDASKYTQGELDENERLLQWVYAFYPTPLAFAWFVVYFGKFFCCVKIKRLRKARNYKYNLLLASLVIAVFYGLVIKMVLLMDLNSGPKLRSAILTAVCELGLICIEVFDERKTRKERHRRKRMLREQQQAEQAFERRQKDSEAGELEQMPPGGML